jgi:Carboxypeptidase regulatory-like domain
MSRLLLASLFSLTALAQNSVEGTVLNDRTGLPLHRAHVVLRPTQTGAQNIGVDTDDRGSFVIRDVQPGSYSIGAARDGYLSSSVCLIGALRLPRTFSISEKQSISGLTFRLRPFAVMAGRISFDDGEPAMGVRVEAYREYRTRLRHGYAIVAAATTNDRGEYRMFGLSPGAYIVAAAYERALPANEQVRDEHALRFTTTFYPHATKLGEASAVRLDYGQEVAGIDIFLERVRKVKVSGRVISGASGQAVAATLALQRLDAHNTASIALPVQPTWDRANRFELRDVTPGQYILWAEGSDGGKILVGRIPITVGAFDIDDAELTIYGDRAGRAVLVQDGDVKLGQSVSIRLEPRNERAKMVNAQEADREFRFLLAAGELYDLFVENLPNDFYVSSVRVNGVDALPFGIHGNAASSDRPFEIVLDSRGGSVSGRVLGSDDSLWSRASVALIPDPPVGRVQSYREGAADENGLFLIHGVAPGKYILVTWLDDAPCDYYDREDLGGCRAVGMTVWVQQASQQDVELKMKAGGKR